MSDRIEAVLTELKSRYADKRVHLFDIAVQSRQDDCLALEGRVLDQETLAALREAFGAQAPGLELDVSAVTVLRKPNPLILTVSTNLSSLHTDTSFLAEQSNQLLYGTPLEVLEERDRWVYVRLMDGYMGWTYRPYLQEEAVPEPTHLVTAPVSRLWASPDRESAVLTRVMSGTGVTVTGVQGEWAEVIANKRGWLPVGHLRALDALPQDAETRRATMVADGLRMTGTPYLWGGNTANGIDCSGLAQLLHRWVGITLPRDADQQYRAGSVVEPPFEPGDLVFFGETRITHVTISLGGWTVLHSSRSQNGVYIDDVQAVDHLRESYYGAASYLRT